MRIARHWDSEREKENLAACRLRKSGDLRIAESDSLSMGEREKEESGNRSLSGQGEKRRTLKRSIL